MFNDNFDELNDCEEFETVGDEMLAIENELGIIAGSIKIELDEIANLDEDNLAGLRQCYNRLDSLFIERLEYSERLEALKKAGV